MGLEVRRKGVRKKEERGDLCRVARLSQILSGGQTLFDIRASVCAWITRFFTSQFEGLSGPISSTTRGSGARALPAEANRNCRTGHTQCFESCTLHSLRFAALLDGHATLQGRTMNLDRDPSVKDDNGGAMNPPERKKLRSSDPDLKISVGTNDEAVDYWYHSSVMATNSNYIDAMLATPMKESKTYEISFPDIAPSTWESMMKFLEGPIAAVRLMTIDDVMEVAPAYDQYDFHLGRELCDQVLKEYFQDKKKILSNLNCFVDAVLLADAANLNEAKRVGVAWLHRTFRSKDSRNGRIIFSQDHISKLVPLIINEENIFRVVAKAFHGTNIKSKEDLRSPLFPGALVNSYVRMDTLRMLREKPIHIKLSGTDCNADGMYTRESYWEYECERSGLWDGVQLNFRVDLYEDKDGWAGWAIGGRIEDGDDHAFKFLWRCPNSLNRVLPPHDGWIPVHTLARGRQPTVSYCMDDID
jgi:hypothetical protein